MSRPELPGMSRPSTSEHPIWTRVAPAQPSTPISTSRAAAALQSINTSGRSKTSRTKDNQRQQLHKLQIPAKSFGPPTSWQPGLSALQQLPSTVWNDEAISPWQLQDPCHIPLQTPSPVTPLGSLKRILRTNRSPFGSWKKIPSVEKRDIFEGGLFGSPERRLLAPGNSPKELGDQPVSQLQTMPTAGSAPTASTKAILPVIYNAQNGRVQKRPSLSPVARPFTVLIQENKHEVQQNSPPYTFSGPGSVQVHNSHGNNLYSSLRRGAVAYGSTNEPEVPQVQRPLRSSESVSVEQIEKKENVKPKHKARLDSVHQESVRSSDASQAINAQSSGGAWPSLNTQLETQSDPGHHNVNSYLSTAQSRPILSNKRSGVPTHIDIPNLTKLDTDQGSANATSQASQIPTSMAHQAARVSATTPATDTTGTITLSSHTQSLDSDRLWSELWDEPLTPESQRTRRTAISE